ncbi:MAG: energy-coupled thiamine transporter ThiT [Coriobacteriales bacterium]|jgi:thiamine transporter|nr:energy-coupled thiamine transporter ThiT [Coriobacteriales bacterium]
MEVNQRFSRDSRVRILVECALALALCNVLSLFKLVQMPFGGSVSLAMLPIAVVALRRGAAAGALVGALWGMLDLLWEPQIVFWAQVILDYPLPFALFGGICGAFAGLYQRRLASVGQRIGKGYQRGSLVVVVAVCLGWLARYADAILSGVLFWAADAPSQAIQAVWIYSVSYNLFYLLPDLVLVAVLSVLVMPLLSRALPARRVCPSA